MLRDVSSTARLLFDCAMCGASVALARPPDDLRAVRCGPCREAARRLVGEDDLPAEPTPPAPGDGLPALTEEDREALEAMRREAREPRFRGPRGRG